MGLLGFIATVPLLFMVRRVSESGRQRRFWPAFGYGTVAGVALFGPLLWWLLPFGLTPFGLLVVIQAAYTGLFSGLMAVWGARRGRPVLAAALWVAIEAARASWPLGGFSWGALAYTQHAGGPALGVARTLGVYGVSLVVIIVAIALEEGIHQAWASREEARAADVPAEVVFQRAQRPLLTILGALSLAVLLSGEPPPVNGGRIEIGIAQAGDTRYTSAAGINRLDSDRIERVATLALAATEPFAEDPPDLVIWPENAVDTDIYANPDSPVADSLAAAVAMVQPSPLFAGEYRAGPQPRTQFNRMTVHTVDGPGDSYAKRRPVPFGEYIPLRRWLDWFPPLDQIPVDTLPGEAAKVVDVAGARVGAIICFENIFPFLARDQVLAGADVLVVSTNNTSFGATAMSRQHVAFSQVRAVETGRWVVHAGLSGISGFIDPEGVVHQETALFQAESPRMEVPLIEGLTPAMRLGSLVPGLAQLIAMAMFGLRLGEWVRRRREQQ